MKYEGTLGQLTYSAELVGTVAHVIAKVGRSTVLDLQSDLLLEAQGLVEGQDNVFSRLVGFASDAFGKPMQKSAVVVDEPVVAADPIAPQAAPVVSY